MISLANLPYRADIKRSRPGTQTGVAPEYYTVSSDTPCRVVAETTALNTTGLGRMATGNWSILFGRLIDLKQADRVIVKKWSETDKKYNQYKILEIETCLSLETHVEATGIERG